MRIDYSKSLADIGPERLERLCLNSEEKNTRQHFISRVLRDSTPRKFCLLCRKDLCGSEFVHRGVDFIRCGSCGHIQIKVIPPEGYPNHEVESESFNAVYPPLNPHDYQDRIKRIYKPKLDWIIRVLDENNIPVRDLRKRRWIELGCGAGYFLSCLASSGFEMVAGFDTDVELVKRADAMTPEYIKVNYGPGSLQDTVSSNLADVYVAFFVLEHVSDLYSFFMQLRELPLQTIFVFSVPIFGMSCLLEGAFDQFYARNLDTIIHTQIFTEKSVRYSMEMAGFEPLAQWVFGQDAEDFCRFLISSLRKNYPDDLLEETAGLLLNFQDELQSLFDVNHLSDQRHIIAIKR